MENGSEVLEVADQEVPAKEVETVEAKEVETVETKIETKEAEGEDLTLPEDAKEKTRRRFNKLLAENEKLKRRAEEAESRLNQPKPTLEGFDHDIEKYTEAATKHATEETMAKATLEEVTKAQRVAQEQILESWNSIKADAVQTYPDFAKVFDNTVTVTQPMAEALIQTENAKDVAYYLGTHRQDAAYIASLPAHMQGFEIARLSMRVKPRPKETTAPPPPSAAARGAGQGGEKRWEDMTDAEFAAMRRKQRNAWRKEHI